MTQTLLSFLLVGSALTAPAFAQNAVVKLNGGLEATILNIGRTKDHRRLTISIKLANKGNETAYLLLVGDPLATDNTGGVFKDFPMVTGITFCNHGIWAPSYCLGIPQKEDWTVPLQSFTQVDPSSDPNAGIVVNFVLAGKGDGPAVSFSSQIYFRLVSDPLRDDTVPEATKYKQFRLMTLSFPPLRAEDAP